MCGLTASNPSAPAIEAAASAVRVKVRVISCPYVYGKDRATSTILCREGDASTENRARPGDRRTRRSCRRRSRCAVESVPRHRPTRRLTSPPQQAVAGASLDTMRGGCACQSGILRGRHGCKRPRRRRRSEPGPADEQVPEAGRVAPVAAANGKEALAYLRGGGDASVIVLDLRMPVMDGWTFRIEQRRDPVLADIPIVVLSGLEMDGIQRWKLPRRSTSRSASPKSSVSCVASASCDGPSRHPDRAQAVANLGDGRRRTTLAIPPKMPSASALHASAGVHSAADRAARRANRRPGPSGPAPRRRAVEQRQLDPVATSRTARAASAR